MDVHILKSYIREVLTGFRSLSSIGPDRALGNIRYGEMTLGSKNKGLLDDLEDEEGWNDEEPLVKNKG
jgi:hypothetical protein